uniref:Uncharacterized protein n=1 Tax=Oryza punctata TaxID=4537 RepID=A0A0E0KSY5_ORYPU
MVKACPRSRWNEDINLWRQIIVPNIPVHNRELSGFYVSLFMHTWKYNELLVPDFQDGNELRKYFLHSYWRSKTTNVK